MEIRYRQLSAWLCADFPDIKPEHIDQYIYRWKKKLKVEQRRKGWYDMEDYVGLKSLGCAYRRLGIQDRDALEYAFSEVKKWRLTQSA